MTNMKNKSMTCRFVAGKKSVSRPWTTIGEGGWASSSAVSLTSSPASSLGGAEELTGGGGWAVLTGVAEEGAAGRGGLDAGAGSSRLADLAGRVYWYSDMVTVEDSPYGF